MIPKDFNELLLSSFPEIREAFDKYVACQDGIDTGSFLVIEDVFMDYFYKRMKKTDYSFLARACEFFENTYLLDDEYASNVIVVGVLENIKSSVFSKMVEKYLLSETRKEYDSITL